jgi:oligopeptide transport system substrate-binding protein
MSDLLVGKLRALRPLAVMGAMGVLVAACGTSTTPTTTSNLAADQTLRFPSDSDIGTLDPAQINAETDVELYQNLFDGLLKFDDQLNPIPDIATSLPTISSDGMTYTFKLNPNAKFWNGDPVTAQDFIFSFSRAAAEGGNAYGSDFDHVVGYDTVSAVSDWAHNQTKLSGMSAPDDHTLVIKLISPWYVFNTELALASAAQVVDPKVINAEIAGPDKNDANWWASPLSAVGTGPYKMVSYIPKQSAEFDAVPNWWGSPQPTVQRVRIDFIGDMSQGVAKYEQGGYDLIGYGGMGSDTPTADILRIQGDPTEGKQLHFVNKVRTIWVQFNFLSTKPSSAKGPWPSPFAGDLQSGPAHDLRMAFSLAIDRSQLVTVACANGITCSAATGGLITKGLKGYAGDNTDPLAKFDPTQAKALLKSGDPTGTKTANLTYFYDPNKAIYKATAENVQSQWKTNLGVTVNLQPVDHATFIKNYTSHDYVMFREGWQADYDHPQDWWDNLFTKNGGSNGGAFTDPVVEQLVAKADAEPIASAIPDYLAANTQMEKDAAYAPLVYFKGEFLFKPYLIGAGSNNFNDFYWNEMKIGAH